MKEVTLARHSNTIYGTFGTMYVENQKFYTIECPWRSNINNISCIPVGSYLCEYNYSPAFRRNMYLVKEVPQRAGIRIHSGNVAGMKSKNLITHFHGCIGLGLNYGNVYGQPGILNSVTAIRKFEELLNKEPFILHVTGEFESYGYNF